jgi:hypothetical protein
MFTVSFNIDNTHLTIYFQFFTVHVFIGTITVHIFIGTVTVHMFIGTVKVHIFIDAVTVHIFVGTVTFHTFIGTVSSDGRACKVNERTDQKDGRCFQTGQLMEIYKVS